jgi:bifunctional DNA-binding transcriptional regulator/antitoxin component of YhaV-PrlF toxin-antitoxin module
MNKYKTNTVNNVILHYHGCIIPTTGNTMAQLTVTARGQVTFKKEVLQHLGIRPGEKIELDLLPDGRCMLKAARPSGTMADFVGLLAGRTHKVASLEEINEAAAQGWSGKK